MLQNLRIEYYSRMTYSLGPMSLGAIREISTRVVLHSERLYNDLLLIGFFQNVFQTEFNSTMPSQLTGKVLIEMESDELNMKLSTVEIINERHIRRCFGVLIARDRVAMPESCWDEDLERWARVGCWKEEQKELYYRELKMVKPIPENNRLYIAAGIVEVQVSSVSRHREIVVFGMS